MIGRDVITRSAKEQITVHIAKKSGFDRNQEPSCCRGWLEKAPWRGGGGILVDCEEGRDKDSVGKGLGGEFQLADYLGGKNGNWERILWRSREENLNLFPHLKNGGGPYFRACSCS